jgi:hypothetical protein
MENLPSPDDSITLETSRGQIKIIPLYFDAIEGWEIKRQLRFYLESEEGEKGALLRKQFTLRVLAYATAIENDSKIRLDGGDANTVNAVLENWKNIEATFNHVLSYNGIDPEMGGEVDAQATKIGAAMGEGFWAQCLSMMSPLIEQYVKAEAEKVAE